MKYNNKVTKYDKKEADSALKRQTICLTYSRYST